MHTNTSVSICLSVIYRHKNICIYMSLIDMSPRIYHPHMWTHMYICGLIFIYVDSYIYIWTHIYICGLIYICELISIRDTSIIHTRYQQHTLCGVYMSAIHRHIQIYIYIYLCIIEASLCVYMSIIDVGLFIYYQKTYQRHTYHI